MRSMKSLKKTINTIFLKKTQLLFHYLLIIFLSGFFSDGNTHERSDHIPLEIWQKVEPYFIPDYHPIVFQLNRIFCQPQILQSIDHFKNAGFSIVYYRVGKMLAVGRHSNFSGYLVKAYMDAGYLLDWSLFPQRIEGAKHIQKFIDQYGFQDILKVPKKWIYPLPKEMQKSSGKNFVLIVEDAELLPLEENKKMFKEQIQRRHLKALAKVIKKAGLSDAHFKNMSFCKDNRIALYDTEIFNNWPVHLEKLTRFLSKDQKPYWEELIKK